MPGGPGCVTATERFPMVKACARNVAALSFLKQSGSTERFAWPAEPSFHEPQVILCPPVNSLPRLAGNTLVERFHDFVDTKTQYVFFHLAILGRDECEPWIEGKRDDTAQVAKPTCHDEGLV